MAHKQNTGAARRAGSVWNKLLRDSRGATVAEFGLVAAPLCFLLFGSVVSGINLMALGLLDAATKEAGRQIQIGAIRGTSDDAVRTLVCGYVSKLTPACSSTLMIYAASGPTFSVVQAATVTGTALSQTSFSPGMRGSSVVLQVALKSPFGLSMANVESTMLMSTAAFRNEP